MTGTLVAKPRQRKSGRQPEPDKPKRPAARRPGPPPREAPERRPEKPQAPRTRIGPMEMMAVAWLIAPAAMLWAPPLWVAALMVSPNILGPGVLGGSGCGARGRGASTPRRPASRHTP